MLLSFIAMASTPLTCAASGIFFALGLLTLPVLAEESVWQSTQSNDWTDARNWSASVVPRQTTLAVFDGSSEVWAGSPKNRALVAGAVLVRGERTAPAIIQPFKGSADSILSLYGHPLELDGASVDLLLGNLSNQPLTITNRSEGASFPLQLEASGIIYAQSTIALGSAIQGAHSIIKRGEGLLLLGDAFTPSDSVKGRSGSTFSGGFTIEQGPVATYWSSARSQGQIAASPFGVGALVLRGGSLRSTSGNPRNYSNAIEVDGDFTLGGETDTNGPIRFNGKAGGTTAFLRDVVLTVNNITTWDQPIRSEYNLVKDGKGMLVIEGDAHFKEIVIRKGTIKVSGTLTCEKIEVIEDGALCGMGAIHCGNIINPAGAQESELTFTHRGREISALVHRPKNYTDGPLLVLLHGATRDSGGYRKSGAFLADKLGMLLVVPEYDRERFDVAAYQEGGVMKDGAVLSPEEWTFASIKVLIDEMSRREGRELPYYLVGHSGGAQFLDRMAAFVPGNAERIISVNPGSLIFPTRDQSYPYGFGGLPGNLGGDEAIKAYLAAPLTLYLGTGDVTSEALPLEGAAMKQGATRIERGRACYAMAKSLAEKNGWPFRWRIVEAEGLGHGSLPMWKHAHAEDAILGK